MNLDSRALRGMPEYRRLLIMAVVGDDERNFPLVHQLEVLKRRDECYKWLIKNQITGKKFFEFNAQFEFSWLRVAKFILSKLDGEKKHQLFVGKDVR